uniref:hypothetical protein n=1 Tax=Ornithobacterium rhinotracheale TaxID=28251 RepID=UPI0039A49F41
MMNLRFTLLSLLLSGSALIYAQQKGHVGVNTESPTESLHVEGSLRVTELPANGAQNAIRTTPEGNDAGSKNQTFNAIKTLVVDKNGVVGAIDALPSSMNNITAENINGTTVYTPVRRCVKATMGQSSGYTYATMTFDQAGYVFSLREHSASKVRVDIKRTPQYANEDRRAKLSWVFNGGATEGGLGGDNLITNDIKFTGEDKRLADISYLTSKAARITIAIGYTAQTFFVDLTTSNQDKVKTANLCVEQTVL